MKRGSRQAESVRVSRDKRAITQMRLAATWQTVCAMLDLGPTAGYKLRKADPEFPAPILLPGVKKHWSVAEIESYLAKRAAARDAEAVRG